MTHHESTILSSILDGIKGINSRLDKIELRLDSLEKKQDNMQVQLNSMETKQTEMQVQLMAVETKQNEMQVQLTAVETKQNEMQVQLDAVEYKQSEMQVQLNSMETKQTEMQVQLMAVETKQNEMQVQLDKHDSTFERVIITMQEGFKRVDERFDEVLGDVRDLRFAVAEFGASQRDTEKTVLSQSKDLERLKEWVHMT